MCGVRILLHVCMYVGAGGGGLCYDQLYMCSVRILVHVCPTTTRKCRNTSTSVSVYYDQLCKCRNTTVYDIICVWVSVLEAFFATTRRMLLMQACMLTYAI